MTYQLYTTPSEDTDVIKVQVQLEVGDYIIPIVYPDYYVAIPSELQEFFGVKVLDNREQFGHAGILIINGQSGISKYYEYGRYEQYGSLGGVNKVKISDARIKNGRITETSLVKILSELSEDAGQGGRIEAVVFIGEYYNEAYKWLNDEQGPYRNRERQAYNVRNFNCMQFVLDVLDSLGIETHWPGLIVKPDDEMEELQELYRDLKYSPGSPSLQIENGTHENNH